jgi:hypothetical protein
MRQTWRTARNIRFHRDINMIRNPNRWGIRYNRWWSGFTRPQIVVVVQDLSWYQPMPEVGQWSYYDVLTVAENLEQLSREVYDKMDAVASTQGEYGPRLRNVLAQLADAADNFSDNVRESTDWSDTLYDLFHLESSLVLAETALDGYSKSWVVEKEMKALRFYVEEMLWTYRQQY